MAAKLILYVTCLTISSLFLKEAAAVYSNCEDAAHNIWTFDTPEEDDIFISKTCWGDDPCPFDFEGDAHTQLLCVTLKEDVSSFCCNVSFNDGKKTMHGDCMVMMVEKDNEEVENKDLKTGETYCVTFNTAEFDRKETADKAIKGEIKLLDCQKDSGYCINMDYESEVIDGGNNDDEEIDNQEEEDEIEAEEREAAEREEKEREEAEKEAGDQ